MVDDNDLKCDMCKNSETLWQDHKSCEMFKQVVTQKSMSDKKSRRNREIAKWGKVIMETFQTVKNYPANCNKVICKLDISLDKSIVMIWL